MDEAENKCLSDVEKYGCQVRHVMAEGDSPPFSYSIGIERSSGSPEIIVVGLEQSLSHFIVNEYNRRARDGEQYRPHQRVSDFIEGFDCELRAMDLSHYRNYLGWALWFYGGSNFRVLQLVYPTTTGIWPWDPDAPSSFKIWQPVLDTSG
ncbi:DUF4262 domain-containing protein [Dyella sp. OK004]|uniref:DUF4262 domain-containing protein n=1 Tax=Dyella sp. OK004 TaxID=1855292 RepID=UPI000B820824|nr:DUF4262 domain-containing protein [Dyella sp. OK004]